MRESTHHLRTREEMYTLAKEWVLSLVPAASTATVVGLSGDLGAGKTTFAQGVALACGVGEVVTSPTFVLQKRYALPHNPSFDTLVHIDAYRLHSPTEARALRLEETARAPRTLVLIEWPERIERVIETHTRITFSDEGEGRTVAFL